MVALLGGCLISREIAYKKLFPGQSRNIKEYLSKKQDFFNHQQRFDIETVEIKYQNGSLHGHIFMPLYKGKIEKVCVCFGSNGWYSFEMMNASMPCSKIAYVCIDYPGYGESTYQKIDEKIIDDFTNAVYDFVQSNETTKGKELCALGFSLGGVFASKFAQKENVKELYLISPISLHALLPLFVCKFLWGFDLNFIINILNINHKCKINICSGGDKDFLSIKKTLFPMFEKETGKKVTIEDVEKGLENKNKNLSICLKIYDNVGHNYSEPIYNISNTWCKSLGLTPINEKFVYNY